MSRFVRHVCGSCEKPFTGIRRQKYCSTECANAAAKKQRQAWERNAKRPPYAYRRQIELDFEQ